MPLRTWFVAMYLLTSTKTNLSALELKRHLGVRYRTAWRLKHKIMHAMMEREETHQLPCFVQLDDAYLGGERNGGKPGHGSENKQPFVIAVSTNEALDHPTFAVIEPVKSFDNASMMRRLAPDAEVYSDGLFCFRRFADAGHAHTVLKTGGGRAATEVRGARWVNIVLSNVNRAIVRALSFDQTSHVRSALPGRSRLPIQPSLSHRRLAAAIVGGNGRLRSLCGTCFAVGEQFSSLRVGANQV